MDRDTAFRLRFCDPFNYLRDCQGRWTLLLIVSGIKDIPPIIRHQAKSCSSIFSCRPKECLSWKGWSAEWLHGLSPETRKTCAIFSKSTTEHLPSIFQVRQARIVLMAWSEKKQAAFADLDCNYFYSAIKLSLSGLLFFSLQRLIKSSAWIFEKEWIIYTVWVYFLPERTIFKPLSPLFTLIN